jgi:hypothetical protein
MQVMLNKIVTGAEKQNAVYKTKSDLENKLKVTFY